MYLIVGFLIMVLFIVALLTWAFFPLLQPSSGNQESPTNNDQSNDNPQTQDVISIQEYPDEEICSPASVYMESYSFSQGETQS